MTAMFKPITSHLDAEWAVAAYPEWHHTFEIFPGVFTRGSHDPTDLFRLLELKPEDVAGKRVLDVGASNGYFSRELDRMGADVTAFDYCDKRKSGFDIMERCYGKEIRHVQGNVADIEKLGLGEFDIILCLGVIYHLPDPIRALWQLRKMCRETFFLETYVEHFEDLRPAARYYHSGELNRDYTNFWAFNPASVDAIMWDVGFLINTSVCFGDRLFARSAINHTPREKMNLAYGLKA